jgi:siderophore synthetase component
MVVAALVEPDPVDGVPPVVRAVQQTGRGDAAGRDWLARHLEVALRPLVRLVVRHGIGLEAHAQNSLVALDDGWPARFVVRDLEGVSLNRDHRRAQEGFGGAVPDDSPALYGEGEMWQRFAYYVLVNHFGQLVAVLAEHVGPSEAELWSVVGDVLADEAVRHGADPAAAPLRALLDAPTLPAKANLVSILEGHGERPTWIGISNPLQAKRRS